MPVSVNVELGKQTVVKLTKAVLIYQEGNYLSDAFATVHDVTGVDEGQPELAPGQLLTAEALREIHKTLYCLQRLEVSPPHVLASSPDRLVWFEPARSRVMFFQSGDAYLNGLSSQSFPQPPLLFVAGERSLKVFALGDDERPTGSSPVFTAPYYNTTAQGVCLGSMPLPDRLSAEETDSYSDAFFHSTFTHGTSERLLRGWGGSYGEVWQHARQQGTFPMQHLVSLERSVEDVINA